MKRIALVLITSFLSLVLASAVAAQGNAPSTPTESAAQGPVFAIQTIPSNATGYFSITLNPGASTSLKARVVTVNSMPLALHAYATNALSLVNGGFGAGTNTDTLTLPATWISFPAQRLKLGLTDHVDIPFTVSVPASAAPGQYVAALIAQTDGPLSIEGTTALHQIIRSAIPVVINVPGTLKAAFSVETPRLVSEGGNSRIVIPVANTGNVLVHPAGQITIAHPDGTAVMQAPIKMGSVFAGDATTIEFNLPSQFTAGDYSISGALTDPDSTVSVTIGPTAVTLKPAGLAVPATLCLDPIKVTTVGHPIQFATISITIDNTGGTIPTGRIVLKVFKNGDPVDDYVLAQNQAMPNGTSSIEERYIPANGWQSGTYSFEVEVSAVDTNGTATTILTTPMHDLVVIP